MTPKQLTYFVHLVELGSFTRAAAALSIRQSTLSRLIKQLETELGHALLIRDGRGVRLTGEGNMLMKHATGILQQIERARTDIENVKGSPAGRVTIGAPVSTGQAFLLKLIQSFRKRFPNAKLDLIDGKSWNIFEWLVSGRIDIGIMYNPRPSELVDVTILSEDRIFLVSPASNTRLPANGKVPVAELGKYPLILPSQPNTMRHTAEVAAAAAGIKLNVTLQVEGAPFILALVSGGEGCTLLPCHSVSGVPEKSVQMNLVVKPGLTHSTAMAVSTQRPATFLVQETKKLIKQHFKFGRKQQ